MFEYVLGTSEPANNIEAAGGDDDGDGDGDEDEDDDGGGGGN